MPAKSNAERYGTVAIAFHWGSALLLAGMFAVGFFMQTVDDAALHLQLVRGHAAAGIVALVLTAARLLWRALDPKPAPPSTMSGAQRAAARVVHALLYLALIVLVLDGIAILVASGSVGTVLGTSARPLPDDFFQFVPRIGHRVTAWAFLALFAAHAAAALCHHWVRGDDVLRRMLPR